MDYKYCNTTDNLPSLMDFHIMLRHISAHILQAQLIQGELEPSKFEDPLLETYCVLLFWGVEAVDHDSLTLYRYQLLPQLRFSKPYACARGPE